uniref:hypothetical protein n=1 Tax=Cupriavidus taiwanensis TaxID=164546 RepID=UPI0011C0711D|nr:hypothetical protein [Cupriavidus taiwanensis]
MPADPDRRADRDTCKDSKRGSGAAQDGRLQPRLSALIAEVRALRGDLERIGAPHAMQDPGVAMAYRARLLDQWIRHAQGRRQLVCLACAAEQGLLSQHHLELGRQTASATSDRALRALYWTSVQRWRRMPLAERSRASAPSVPRHSPCHATPDMCDLCHELRHDARRSFPHAELVPDRDAVHRHPQAATTLRYDCLSCATHWVRRVLPWEPFVAWTVVQPRQAPYQL